MIHEKKATYNNESTLMTNREHLNMATFSPRDNITNREHLNMATFSPRDNINTLVTGELYSFHQKYVIPRESSPIGAPEVALATEQTPCLIAIEGILAQSSPMSKRTRKNKVVILA
ncbi:hypothetical protein ACFE04_026673 [Oxalis oulophora]